MRSLAEHSWWIIFEGNERNKIKILLRLESICDIIDNVARGLGHFEASKQPNRRKRLLNPFTAYQTVTTDNLADNLVV